MLVSKAAFRGLQESILQTAMWNSFVEKAASNDRLLLNFDVYGFKE